MFKKIAVIATLPLITFFLTSKSQAHTNLLHLASTPPSVPLDLNPYPTLTAVPNPPSNSPFIYAPDALQAAETFFAEPWSTSVRKDFKTDCTLTLPMNSDKLFIQDGVFVDFHTVTQQGAGNIYMPYCIFSIDTETFLEQIVPSGKLVVAPGSHEFKAPDVTIESQDFFSTVGVSVRYFSVQQRNEAEEKSLKKAKSPFTDAHCFTPATSISYFLYGYYSGTQGGSQLQTLTLKEVEQELAIQCSSQTISVPALKTKNLVKKRLKRKSKN